MTSTGPESSTEGLLAIWHDVAPGSETLVRDWYNEEHHAERLMVPGFLSAHRYQRASGEGTAIMTLYRTVDPDVLWSAPYRERLQRPSDRTRAVMPVYRNMCRTACRIAWSTGVADGGAVAVLAVADDPRPSDRQWERLSTALQATPAMPGVLRYRWIVRVAPQDRDGPTAEPNLRSTPDSEIAWALLVDAGHEHEALDGLARIEQQIGPLPADDARIRQRACYRLLYASYRQ